MEFYTLVYCHNGYNRIKAHNSEKYAPLQI